MERATSPPPSSSSSSQDFPGRPTQGSAASYRLFPVVEAPPPATPTTPKKRRASLNKAAGGRSSSLGNQTPPKGTSIIASIGTTGATAHTKQSVTSFRESRKASLPELHPLRAVKELRNHSTESCPTARFIENNGARPQDHRNNASTVQAGPGESVSGQKRADAKSSTHASTQMSLNTVAVIRPKRVDSLSPSSPRPQGQTSRPKPNLRIAIGLAEQSSIPPAPPTKSPRHLYREPEHAGAASATFGVRTSAEPSRTADQAQPSVAQQQAITPVGAEVRVRERLVTSPTARGYPTQTSPRPKMHIFPKEQVYGQSRSPTRPLSRPSTAIPAVTSNTAGEASANAPLQVTDCHRELTDVSRPRESRSGLQPPYGPPNVLLRTCKSTGTLKYTSQRVSLRAVETNPAYSSQAAPQHDLLTRVPTPSSPAPSAADESESIASAIRKHAVSCTEPSDVHISRSPQDGETSLAGPRASESFARLALARANVAALRSAESSLGGVEEARSSGLEYGAFNRALTAETLSRGLASPESRDPIRALKELASQVEALHARYTHLKVERQKMSAGLVEKLKTLQPGSDFANVLINDQLSLAAISSSMDICFAKLKSLECRKEDAISALIAQATNTARSPGDNAASVSTVSRKPSWTPSAETESQYAATGRSTPDLGESFSTKRSTQSSLPRTLSYTSELGSQSYRLSEISRNSSLRLETSVTRLSDAAQKEAPATIAEVTESPDCMNSHGTLLPATTREASPLFTVVSSHKENGTEESLVKELEDVSSSEDSSLEELLEPKSRPRSNGLKAAKVLGVPKEVGAGKVDTASKSPVEKLTLSALRRQEAEADQDRHVLLPISSGIAASPLTTFTKATDASSDYLESPAFHNLEAELQNFPKPSQPVLAATQSLPTLHTALPGPLSMNPPTPAFSPPDWDEDKRFRHDSATLSREPSCKDTRPKRTMTMGSTRTTHTINVYLEQPAYEDFMEFY